MNAPPALVVRLAARTLPARLRETIVGDALEEAAQGVRGPAWTAFTLVRIAVRFQLEPYAQPADRARALALLGAAAVALWVVPIATATLYAGPPVFEDPASRAIVELLRAAAVTSALACGLVAGGAPLLTPHAQAARWHVALVLAGASLLRDGGLGAAVALLAATWLASRIHVEEFHEEAP